VAAWIVDWTLIVSNKVCAFTQRRFVFSYKGVVSHKSTRSGVHVQQPSVSSSLRVKKNAEVPALCLKVLFIRCLLLFLFCVGFAEQGIVRESWGAVLFETQRHDFGSVVIGADAEFLFELTNTLNSNVRLLSLRSSCTCVSAKFSTQLLAPGETGAVIARLNTSGQHLQNRSAVLTIQLERILNGARRIDTVQLFVSGYIRPDVILTPGSVEFGVVAEGTAAERTLLMEYTGQPGWALMSVERSQPYIYARAEEVKREQGNVAYKITVILEEDAPAGYVRDVLRFTTNELQQGKSEPVEIVLPIQGVVRASIQAKPSPMLVGILSPGETVTKNIIIQSETPFRVANVSATDNRFRFAFSEQASTVQLISVSFSARQIPPGVQQDFAQVIRIATNDPQQPSITVNAFVRVVPHDD